MGKFEIRRQTLGYWIRYLDGGNRRFEEADGVYLAPAAGVRGGGRPGWRRGAGIRGGGGRLERRRASESGR
jgi:hypothetical protein